MDTAQSFVISSDGKRVGYKVAKEVDGQIYEQMVIDDVPGPLFTRVSHLSFNKQGTMTAYRAYFADPATGTVRVAGIIGGSRTEVYDDIISEFVFSSDSSRITYYVEQGGKIEEVSHQLF